MWYIYGFRAIMDHVYESGFHGLARLPIPRFGAAPLGLLLKVPVLITVR